MQPGATRTPQRSRAGAFEHRAGRRDVDLGGEPAEAFLERGGSIPDGPDAKGVVRRRRGSGRVQCPKEAAEELRGAPVVGDGGAVARHPGLAPHDRPRQGKAGRRSPLPEGHRHGERQAPYEQGQPSLLVEEQRSGGRATWQRDEEFLAQAPQCVVPTRLERADRQVGQVRMLLGEEPPDEFVIELDRRGGQRCQFRLTLT
jgi:hypothetical protein